MIDKIQGTKNGYQLRADSTNEELGELLRRNRGTKALVVNRATMKKLNPRGTLNCFTVNNRVPDGAFYLNTMR